MKKPLLTLLLLVIIYNFNAQDYRKYWTDGNLNWNDFQAKPTKNVASHLAYVLLYQSDKKVINNITYYGIFSDAYVDKSLSFVNNNIKDAYHLKYNQVIFNLLEIKKRELQKRIYNLDNVYEINSLFSDSKSQLERRILDFQEEGNYGIQKEVTDNWLAKTNLELQSSNSFELPDYRKSNWTYGLYGGLDFGLYGGKYKEIFNNTIALSLGFEFSYKKVFMGLNMTFTNSKLNNNLVDNSFIIPEAERSTIGLFNAYFGYPVYETEKFRIMPFAGYGITVFGEVGEDKNKEETTKGTSIFGLNFDFKNKKTVNFIPTIFNLRDEGNSYFRARIFLSNSNFNQNLKGYILNLGISYGIEGRILSKK
ncbi:hypothetical protein JL193_12080 [Polaribacter batillariae]|uniref:Outer membrane protein beta-barrel domain-containing protein n=1 Tax=Polaribacter batillariae TaxID=2808900 RepID=A0ABX7SRI4_9FLAO|nr:hypothetical protein [Polaribacter batillariae]QTD36860.1 hypothetical protein JL193_12080 [Polaribacter batillariae]